MNRTTASLARNPLAPLALGLALASLALPASAQPLPWVGLGARGAGLLAEQGQGHHAPGAADHFGRALAAGDFDGDGYDDLAVGAVGYDANANLADIGLVAVVYGSSSGLGPGRVTWLWEDLLFGPGQSETGDHFGAALAAGDFTGDGRTDLAIGIPSENTAVVDAGAVALVPGTPQGLAGGARRLHPGGFPLGLVPDVEAGSPLYGLALAAGDFDGNGFDDLAIGAPDRDDAAAGADVGGAAVLYGNLLSDDFESGGRRLWSATAP